MTKNLVKKQLKANKLSPKIPFYPVQFFPVPSGKINRDRELQKWKNRDRESGPGMKKPGIPGHGHEVYNPTFNSKRIDAPISVKNVAIHKNINLKMCTKCAHFIG